MSIREALIHMFTDDPVNWLKWALVFAVLIGGYFVAIPLYGRLSHGMSWERKRDIARSRNHIIKASIVKKWPSGDVGHYNWHATYRYTLQGEERRYTAYFKHPSTYKRGSQYANFMKELTTYTRNGKVPHDDAPDSLSLLENEIRMLSGGKVEVFKRPF